MSVFHWKSKYICVSRSVVSDSASPWTIACQVLLSMEFPRQEYWSGLPFPSPGHLPNAGTDPRSPTLQVDSLPSVVQSLSRAQLFVTPWITARQTSLSFTISWSLCKLMSIESVMPSNHIVFCHPLLLLPSIFPSIRVFSNESALHIRQPKNWSFSLSIGPSNDYSGFSFGWTGWISLQSKGRSRVFSNTMVQKHQFFNTQPSLLSNSHIHT